jgi:hypothetical protein
MQKTQSIAIAVSSFVAGVALALSCGQVEMQRVDAEEPRDCSACAAQAVDALASRLYTVDNIDSHHASFGSVEQVYSIASCADDDIKLSGSCWVSPKDPTGFTDTLGNEHRLIGGSHMQGPEEGQKREQTHICLYDNVPRHKGVVKVTATVVCLRMAG